MPEIASTLDAVTVFPDRARVLRRGQIKLEPGQLGLHRLDFSGLPMTLLPDSMRASGRGSARARLLGVSVRVQNYRETPAEAVRELEAKIQAATDTDLGLGGRADVLAKAQKALDGLAAQSDMFARGLAPISQHEQIKLEAVEPRPAKHSELNQLEWKLRLDKGARQVIQFEYSAEFPRTMDVVGLE